MKLKTVDIIDRLLLRAIGEARSLSGPESVDGDAFLSARLDFLKHIQEAAE
jgi:hypothetical protein